MLITEVDPACEGITITNVSFSWVNLEGWYLTDSEGKLFFHSRTLSPGCSLTVVKTRGDDWFSSREDVVEFGMGGTTKSGSLVLANGGDDISLYSGSTLIDSVCYGSSVGVAGWNGAPVECASRQYMMRVGGDTDTSSDWISTRPGWTNLSFPGTGAYDARVTPFTFPESEGIPIIDAIGSAQSRIDISIYLLTSRNLCALLCDVLQRGVEVRILLEGSPLGTDISNELSMMKNITGLGGEVHLINSGSGNPRFTYLHNKYAVIDGDKVIITSENWTNSNFGEEGNRGWGALVESPDYASYMEAVFENDFSTEWGDVRELNDVYPSIKPIVMDDFTDPGQYMCQTFDCTVSPILSPDNSFDTMGSLMSSVSTVLYSEQLDLGSNLSSASGDTPVSWMASAASRGADVRFILDASQSTSGDHRAYVNLINGTTGIQALAVDGREGFDTIHNKGIIMDSSVWLGSVNWTSTSLKNNRETAVLINSAEVSQYFSRYFLSDFGVSILDVERSGLKLTASVFTSGSSEKVHLSADGPSDCTYVWEFGDGTRRITGVPDVVFDAPSPGKYIAKVTIQGTNVRDEVEYEVPGEDGGPAFLFYGSASLILVLGTAVSFLRNGSNGRHHSRDRSPYNASRGRGRRL
ncbi:Phosphatidylserine/phosphatidylglycerophosphate/cardiolipin synthase-related enzyme [Thermoplasmatales archaeon BRNA1]|nr:Phosphatidylserine/phosphatidylglycerophosphate/cardiolipin synthase-related enzyme [Thermoplasmatales archaeon BRNA1]